jgi:hypothetical protein
MLKTKSWIWTFGLLVTQVFVMCVVRDLISPLPSSIRSLFEILLPGFKWLTLGTFLIGLAESFLWGVYAALVLVPAANIFLLKHRDENRHLQTSPGRRHGHKAAA